MSFVTRPRLGTRLALDPHPRGYYPNSCRRPSAVRWLDAPQADLPHNPAARMSEIPGGVTLMRGRRIAWLEFVAALALGLSLTEGRAQPQLGNQLPQPRLSSL